MIHCVIAFSQSADKEAIHFSDSLQRLANNATNDSVKVQHLLDLSFFWSDRDTSKAFACIKQAEQVMGKRANNYYKGLFLHFKANVIYTYDIARAKNYYLQGDKYLSKYSFPRAFLYRAKAWNNYGTLLQIQDSASRYMDVIIEKALPYSRRAGDSLTVGNNLQNIALILSNLQDHRKADSYFGQAIRTLAKYPRAHEEKLTVYVNAAKNSILGNDLSKARTYLNRARRELQKIPHSNYAANYYRTEGVYYRHLKQTDKALENFALAIPQARKLLDDYILRDIYFEIYATYRDIGDYVNAKKNLLIANKYSPNTILQNRLLHLRELANTEYHLKNYKEAFETMRDYALGKDTFTEKNMAIKVLDLEKKYQTIGKENQILKLQDANQKQQLSIQTNKLWIVLLVMGLIVSVVVAFFTWKLAKTNKSALKQTEQLYEKELLNLKHQEQLKQFGSILQGQEQERNRISRDLHDGLGGLLAGIKLRLSAIANKEREKNEAPNAEIETVIHQLDHSVDELRRVARNMMPEALLYMGLMPALADLCKYMDTERTAVKFQSFDLQASYQQPVLVGVYRIVQELLNNAIKHAYASQIIVQCSQIDKHLLLTVEDDGCGFHAEEVELNGLGLKNVRNRVALLGGKAEIESKTGEGTTINIEIPV